MTTAMMSIDAKVRPLAESAGRTARGEMRVAIVGCGAVTEKKHLPALATSSRVRVTALVDVDELRLQRLGQLTGIRNLFRNVVDVGQHADMAIIAVPHHLHTAVAVEAMTSGLHVFVEKPLATTMRDVHAMLEASARFNRKIGVGLVRRQYSSYKYVKAFLEQGCFGAIRSFDFREGAIYNWPVATQATFRKETAGGVLFDTGGHALDLLLSWLGDFREVRYREDSEGGVEANCLMELTLCNGVSGVIELSRTRNLRNTCIIRGERGEIEIGVGAHGPVTIRVDGLELSGGPRIVGRTEPAPLEFTRIQIEEFAGALEKRQNYSLFAENTLPSIRLFDACKAQPELLELPWSPFRAAPDLPDMSGRTVLVIGGTGFIGGRLVETLARHTGARVRVLFRDPTKLPGVARFDVETCHGDMTDAKALASALPGCDVVFNCAFGRGSRTVSHRVNVDAVKTLIEEAARAGVRRVVHLSTVAAYGIRPDGELRETDAHHAPRSHTYGFTKWQGEQVGFAAARAAKVELLVLQPTIVYGPSAPTWTINPLRMLKSLQVALPEGGSGFCNAVYVDDVVQAMLRAAGANGGAGERFLVSAAEPVTWREFYAAYESMLGFASTIALSLEELSQLRKRELKAAGTLSQLSALVRDPAVFRRLSQLGPVERLKTMLPRPAIEAAKQTIQGSRSPQPDGPGETATKPIHVPPAFDALLLIRRTRVSIQKAAHVLGYRPLYSFAEGIVPTAQWADWANLLS